MQLRSPFMQQLQQNMRMRGYSMRTEKIYLYCLLSRFNQYLLTCQIVTESFFLYYMVLVYESQSA